jgi:ribosomal protein L40E
MNPSDVERCPACGATLPPDAQFCVECGQRVAPAATGPTQQLREVESGVRCPACGALNPAHARFCVTCGQSLPSTLRDASASPEPQPVVPTVPAPAAPPEPAASGGPGTRRWASSGAAFLIGLAILAVTGWWWPGILVVIAVSMVLDSGSAPWSWANMQGVVWLLGIALLAVTGWWWPGILVLVGLSALFGSVARPGR